MIAPMENGDVVSALRQLTHNLAADEECAADHEGFQPENSHIPPPQST